MGKRISDDTVRRLLGPAEPGLLCDQCFDRLDEYVELELRGRPADGEIPGMGPHLDGCPACHEEYQRLRELAKYPGGEPARHHG